MNLVVAINTLICFGDLGTAQVPTSTAPETIVVQARRSKLPITAPATTVLDSVQLKSAPFRTPEEMLRQVPGLTVIQHGSEGKGYQFFIRGFDAVHGSDISVTIDGVPVNEWSNVHAQGYIDLGYLLPESIREIEVTKGPYELDQGAFATAGTLQFELGIPQQHRGTRLNYTLGSTGRHRVFAGYSPSNGDGSEFVGIAYTRDEGFGATRNLERVAVNGQINLASSPGVFVVTAQSLLSYGRFGLPTPVREDDLAAGRIDFLGSYDEQTQGSSGQGQLSLTTLLTLERQSLQVTLFGRFRTLSLLENYTGFLREPLEGDRRAQEQTTWSSGLTLRHRAELFGQLSLESGAGALFDWVQQDESDRGLRLQRLRQRRDLSIQQAQFHIFSGLTFRPSKTLLFQAGGRLDVAQTAVDDGMAGESGGGADLIASPRLRAQWQILEPLRLFGAYGRGFRPPEARAFARFEPATVGTSEAANAQGSASFTTSDAAELGLRWTPWDFLTSTLTGFGVWIQNESVFDHVSGVSVDLAGTERLGLEWTAELRPTSWMTLAVDLTGVDARFSGSEEPVPFAPAWTGAARASVDHPSGFSSGARLWGIGERNLPFNAVGEGFVWLDLTAGYRWDIFQLHLEVENLLDSTLREGVYHYASAFSVPSQLPALHYSAGPPRNLRVTLGILLP